MRRLLEGTGDFIVEVETKAITALHHAETFRPDLIIMDVNMPGPDGFALARNIRREPWLRHRPIVFFSGMSDLEKPLQAAWRAGPTEFLQKGVSPDVIVETIQRILAERITLYRASLAA